MLLTVVSQPAAGGTITLYPVYSDSNYYADDPVRVTAQAADGYLFAEWSGDVSGIPDVTNNVVEVVMTQDKTITASFVESGVRYSITAAAEPVAGGAVAVSPAQDNYTLNQVVSVSAAAAPGYVFSHWAGDLAGSTAPAELRMNGNKAIAGVFNPVLSAGVETPGTGTVEADPPAAAGGYPAGTAVSLTARPAVGFLFDQWTGDTDGLADPRQASLTLVVAAPRTLTARFLPAPRYALTAAVEGQVGGSLSLQPEQPAGGYLAGEPVTVRALAADGYAFSYWTGDLSGADPAPQLHLSGPLTIGAVFDPLVTLEIDPPEGGEVDAMPPRGSGGYPLGSEVTLEARPAPGYKFTGWSGDASGTESVVTIVADAPKTVTAAFAKQRGLAWWWIPLAAGAALLVLIGMPLEAALRRRLRSH